MPKTDGINALMGIIPIPDQYDINHNAKRINTVYTIDHYAYPSGSKPEKSKRVRGPIIPEVGSLYRSNGALPYKPSYAKIDNMTELSDPDNYELKHIIEIKDNEVFFNGSIIARAPLTHNNGKKFTIAQKAQFCKAVVYSIIPGEIKTHLNEMGKACKEIRTITDDLYFRELIAQYPAIVPQKESQEIPAIIPDDLVLPETISAYTPEAITGYPENIFKYTPDYSVPEYDALLINGMFDHGPSMMDNEIDTAFMDEIEKESIGEMFVAFNPSIVQKYNVPHLRLSITEERVTA